MCSLRILAAKNNKWYLFGILFWRLVHFRVVRLGSPSTGGQCFVHHPCTSNLPSFPTFYCRLILFARVGDFENGKRCWILHGITRAGGSNPLTFVQQSKRKGPENFSGILKVNPTGGKSLISAWKRKKKKRKWRNPQYRGIINTWWSIQVHVLTPLNRVFDENQYFP